MKSISTCLWFNTEAEAAAKFYVSIFKNSKILRTTYYSDAGPMPKGTVLTVEFKLGSTEFVALNGGPQYKFTEAVSLSVPCESQKEVDYYWRKLSAGGEEGPCGWLKDKFGLSWQIVPTALMKMIASKDTTRTTRAMQALFKMGKLDIKTLQQAYDSDGKPTRTKGRKPKRKSA